MPPDQEAYLFDVVRHGHFLGGFHLASVRLDTGGRDGVTEENLVSCTECSLRRRKLEAVLPQALKKVLHVEYVSGGGRRQTR